MSRLPQADGAGRQKVLAIHQPCGSYLSLRDLRDQDETNGEGALESVSSIPNLFGNPFERTAGGAFEDPLRRSPSRSITARKLIGCSHFSRFEGADQAGWYLTTSPPAPIPGERKSLSLTDAQGLASKAIFQARIVPACGKIADPSGWEVKASGWTGRPCVRKSHGCGSGGRKRKSPRSLTESGA